MISTARLTSTAALLLQLAGLWVPLLRYANRDFAGSDIDLAEAALASPGGLLLIPGFLLTVACAVLAWFGIRDRAWGWLAGTASLMLIAGAISTVWAADRFVIMWDGFDEERGLPIGGMEVAEPSWGLVLIGLAAIALAIGAIARLLGHPSRGAQRDARVPGTPGTAAPAPGRPASGPPPAGPHGPGRPASGPPVAGPSASGPPAPGAPPAGPPGSLPPASGPPAGGPLAR